jgi:hypothetical protein
METWQWIARFSITEKGRTNRSSLSDRNGRITPRKSDDEIRYQVTDMGLLSSELGSHSAQVLCLGTKDGNNMIWNVAFEATHRANLWKANLASYVATPRL